MLFYSRSTIRLLSQGKEREKREKLHEVSPPSGPFVRGKGGMNERTNGRRMHFSEKGNGPPLPLLPFFLLRFKRLKNCIFDVDKEVPFPSLPIAPGGPPPQYRANVCRQMPWRRAGNAQSESQLELGHEGILIVHLFVYRRRRAN